MRKFIFGLLAALAMIPAPAQAACTAMSTGMQLKRPGIADPFDVWSVCIREMIAQVNSSAAYTTPGSTTTAFYLGDIYVSRIGGRSIGTPGIRLSSAVFQDEGFYFLTRSSMAVEGGGGLLVRYHADLGSATVRNQLVAIGSVTFQDGNFSVGGSTFVVAGGTVTANRLQLLNALAVVYGGTGRTSLDQDALLYGSGSSPPVSLPVLGNGGLVIGTGASPSTGTITGTVNQITVTNGAGSITLSLPQNIHISASPTFSTMTLQGNAFSVGGTTFVVNMGQVMIGTNTAPASAVFFTSDVTKGVLFNPMSATQRDAIVSPANGLLIFNTTSGKYNYYNGGVWNDISGGGGHVIASGTVSGSTVGVISGQLQQQTTLYFDSAGFELFNDSASSSTIVKSKHFQYLASTSVFVTQGVASQNTTNNPSVCLATATIVTGNNRLFIASSGGHQAGASTMYVNFLVDGQSLPGWPAGSSTVRKCGTWDNGSNDANMTCTAITPVVSAGTHSVCMAMGSSGGGAVRQQEMAVFELGTGGSGFALPLSSASVNYTSNISRTEPDICVSTLTITTLGTEVDIIATGWATAHSGSNGYAVMDALVNGSRISGTTRHTVNAGNVGGSYHPMGFTKRVTVTPGVNNFCIAPGEDGAGTSDTLCASTSHGLCVFEVREVRNAPGTGDVSSNGNNNFSGINSLAAGSTLAPAQGTSNGGTVGSYAIINGIEHVIGSSAPVQGMAVTPFTITLSSSGIYQMKIHGTPSTTTDLYIRFNGDTGANYKYSNSRNLLGSPANDQTNTGTFCPLSIQNAGTDQATSGETWLITVDFAPFVDSLQKVILTGYGGHWSGSRSSGVSYAYECSYYGAAPITSVSFGVTAGTWKGKVRLKVED